MSTIDQAIPLQDARQQKPWKYLGYEAYAQFIASDDDFFILRRFSYLTARVLLSLQDELLVHEDELAAIEVAVRKEDLDVHNGAFRSDRETEPKRKELVRVIATKLKEYSTKT